jgi:hypothetical protein
MAVRAIYTGHDKRVLLKLTDSLKDFRAVGKSGAPPQNSGSELFSLVNEARCLDGRFEQPRQGADLLHIDTGGHLEDHLDPFRYLRGNGISVFATPDFDTDIECFKVIIIRHKYRLEIVDRRHRKNEILEFSMININAANL